LSFHPHGPTRNYLKSLIDQAGSTTLFGAEN
jgi:hypothetical protein